VPRNSDIIATVIPLFREFISPPTKSFILKCSACEGGMEAVSQFSHYFEAYRRGKMRMFPYKYQLYLVMINLNFPEIPPPLLNITRVR